MTTKKRKLEDGTETITSTATITPAPKANSSRETSTPASAVGTPVGGKGKRVQGQRFERIKADSVTFHDPGLMDNSFEARERTGANANDYGAKASRDLIVTRGAGFRKEKNKKKRGSYVGGEITLQTHSIKFDD